MDRSHPPRNPCAYQRSRSLTKISQRNKWCSYAHLWLRKKKKKKKKSFSFGNLWLYSFEFYQYRHYQILSIFLRDTARRVYRIFYFGCEIFGTKLFPKRNFWKALKTRTPLSIFNSLLFLFEHFLLKLGQILLWKRTKLLLFEQNLHIRTKLYEFT